MITFRCRCSHAFSVPDDQAGESLQCPSCGLLVDVPTLDDMASLDADGAAYGLQASRPAKAPLPDVRDTPSILARHDQKDRRMPLAEFLKIGTTEEDLLQIKDEVRPGVPKHPKYDPVTGELIVPMPIRRDPVKSQTPMLAQPVVLGYQKKKVHQRALSVWMPFKAMFELPNFIVCLLVAVVHTFTMVLLVMGMDMWLLLLLVLPMLVMPIAHFASIVDETGPSGNDEMPRPLRGANLYEDYSRPLVQVVFAYLFAYAPLFLVNKYITALPWYANVPLGVASFALAPAFLITLITSGAINNMLPQRSLSVIWTAGWDYWIATVIGFFATIGFFISSLFAASIGDILSTILLNPKGPAALKGTLTGVPYWVELPLTLPVVFIACYLMHVFSWQLGIIYRKHHERFAWVLQKHDSSVRDDTIAQLHKQRQREAEERAARTRQNMERRVAASDAHRPLR